MPDSPLLLSPCCDCPLYFCAYFIHNHSLACIIWQFHYLQFFEVYDYCLVFLLTPIQ